MSAILGRIYSKGESVLYEYLERVPGDATRDDSFRWTSERWAAHWFSFSSYAEELKAVADHSEVIDGREVRPWAIHGTPPNRPNVEPDCGQPIGAAAPKYEPAPAPKKKAKGVSPAEAAKGDIPARIKAAKQNRKVAAERKVERNERTVAPADGADKWKAVFERRVSPQQCFEETERRLGEHE